MPNPEIEKVIEIEELGVVKKGADMEPKIEFNYSPGLKQYEIKKLLVKKALELGFSDEQVKKFDKEYRLSIGKSKIGNYNSKEFPLWFKAMKEFLNVT